MKYECSVPSMDTPVDFTEAVPVVTLPNSTELPSATFKLPKEVAESFHVVSCGIVTVVDSSLSSLLSVITEKSKKVFV